MELSEVIDQITDYEKINVFSYDGLKLNELSAKLVGKVSFKISFSFYISTGNR
jgi:hypothetical protein